MLATLAASFLGMSVALDLVSAASGAPLLSWVARWNLLAGFLLAAVGLAWRAASALDVFSIATAWTSGLSVALGREDAQPNRGALVARGLVVGALVLCAMSLLERTDPAGASFLARMLGAGAFGCAFVALRLGGSPQPA